MYVCVCSLLLTCERAGVSEGPYVRVGQLGEQRDDGVHQVTVKDDAVLTLSHQHRHKVAELRVEPAAVRSGLYERILHAVLRPRRGGKGGRGNTLKGQRWMMGKRVIYRLCYFFTFLM